MHYMLQWADGAGIHEIISKDRNAIDTLTSALRCARGFELDTLGVFESEDTFSWVRVSRG